MACYRPSKNGKVIRVGFYSMIGGFMQNGGIGGRSGLISCVDLGFDPRLDGLAVA